MATTKTSGATTTKTSGTATSITAAVGNIAAQTQSTTTAPLVAATTRAQGDGHLAAIANGSLFSMASIVLAWAFWL